MKNHLHQDVVPSKSGFVRVSTVDLSVLDLPDTPTPMLRNLFASTGGHIETMVFPCDAAGEVMDWTGLDVRRSKSTEDAKSQHDAMVSEWSIK